MRTAEEEWGGIDPKKVALLQDLISAAREQGRREAVEEAQCIALQWKSPRIASEILKLLPNKEG